MSIYDTVHLTRDGLSMKPNGIYSDNVAIELVGGEGIWIEDGIINMPVRLWEELQRSQSQLWQLARSAR